MTDKWAAGAEVGLSKKRWVAIAPRAPTRDPKTTIKLNCNVPCRRALWRRRAANARSFRAWGLGGGGREEVTVGQGVEGDLASRVRGRKDSNQRNEKNGMKRNEVDIYTAMGAVWGLYMEDL